MEKTDQPKVLIIDPIFRGSRLTISCHVGRAINGESGEVHILSRKQAVSDHYHELFTFPHTLFSDIPLPEDFWYGKIPKASLIVCFGRLASLLQVHQYRAFFFTGWEEYFPLLPLSIGSIASPLNRVPAYAISYNPAFWLKGQNLAGRSIWKRSAQQFLTLLSLRRFFRLNFFAFDERLFERRYSRLPSALHSRYFLAPDPSPDIRLDAAGRPGDGVSLLLVGLQSARKGLGDILNLLEAGPLPGKTKLRLVGRLSEETSKWEPRLRRAAQLQWENRFVPEDEIRRAYHSADYVVLPYTRDFNSSSGVLAFACAFGKPVISTAHGLIGYRVKKYGLGFTYESADSEALRQIILQLPPPNSDAYAQLSNAGRKYAQANSEIRFQQQIASALFRGNH